MLMVMTDADFKTAIEERLVSWFKVQTAAALTPEAKVMIERLQASIVRAGKRSRPRLLQLTYQAYGGTDTEQLLDIGLALELHHQFLLVHDDIIDNDVVRYDGPNLLGYYRQDFPAEQSDVANSMALIGGNLAFTYACQAILDHPTLPDSDKVTVLSLLQTANIGVHAGQQLDILNVLSLHMPVDEARLAQTNYLKTAVYSVRLPMQTAAALLALPQEERAQIDTFARSFGSLYQLVDDYSDYFSNDSSFDNHPKYRDFRQGKLTYPLLKAFELADEKDAALLRNHAGSKLADETIMQQVAAVLEHCGAKAASRQQIQEYFEQTQAALAQLQISEDFRSAFATMLAAFRV